MGKTKLLFLMLFLMTLCACNKETVVLDDPALKLKVVNADTNEPIVNGVVLLYSEYGDWYESTSPISATVTDLNGEAIFHGLEEKIYYFDAYTTGYWNYPKGIYSIENPLEMGKITTVKVSLFQSSFDITE